MDKKQTSVGISRRNPEKYEYAYMLFMQKESLKDISEKTGVSSTTLTKWKNEGGWEVKRASRHISIDTLIANTMVKINELLESDNFSADSFAKAVNQLKTLKGGATSNDRVNALQDFGDWLIGHSRTDRTIDEAFIRRITQYQDKYILTVVNGKE